MRRLVLLVVALLAALSPAAATAQSPFPKLIALPDGFQPEGIAIQGTTFYVGSIPTGAVVRGDVRTGRSAQLVAPTAGRAAIGMKVHGERLFVAGGPTGHAFVYDARSGTPLADHVLAGGSPFINDVAIGRRAAYFTNSRAPEVYAVPLRGGEPRRIALTGDFQQTGGPDANNLNGIDVAGNKLVLVQTNTGKLFTADPRTGDTDEIDLGGETVVNGDGILLVGRILFVVQNRDNQIAVIRLSRDLSRGTVLDRRMDPGFFDVPTTLARAGRFLYAVNARFGTAGDQPAPYNIVRIP